MKPHWTPQYIFDRTLEWIFHRTHPSAPWLGPAAIRLLDKLLKPHFTGLEAGAGRSTPWIANRVRQLVSLEENEQWLLRVRRAIAKKGLQNVTMQSVSTSTDTLAENYLRAIAHIPDESLDFATVDSEHARSVIALALVSKLKPGAFLMIDNANWFLPSDSRSPASRSMHDGPLDDDWRRLSEATDLWMRKWTSSGVTDTVFFFKPRSSED